MITKLQRKALLFIEAEMDSGGVAPSVRELADYLRYRSPSPAQYYPFEGAAYVAEDAPMVVPALMVNVARYHYCRTGRKYRLDCHSYRPKPSVLAFPASTQHARP